ncbi:hypothetical protein ACLOJK_007191 [Asimina triloba]
MSLEEDLILEKIPLTKKRASRRWMSLLHRLHLYLDLEEAMESKSMRVKILLHSFHINEGENPSP